MRIKYLIASHNPLNYAKKKNFTPPTTRQYTAWTKNLDFHPSTPALKVLSFSDKKDKFYKNAQESTKKLLDSIPSEYNNEIEGKCYNITEDFVRCEIKEREYYSVADELIRLGIKPENILCLNDEFFEETESGFNWRTKVSVISFDNVRDTLRFLWFNKMMLNPNSVHYKMLFSECFESAGILVEGKANTIDYCPPTTAQIIRLWTMLRYGFNCPPHLECLLTERDLTAVNTKVQKIRNEHSKLFDKKRGGTDFGIVPPLTTSFSADCMEDSPVVAFNRFSKLNKEFEASETQKIRFSASHHSMLLNNFGLSWSGSNNRKSDLPTLSSAFLADQSEAYSKNHDESVSYCRSLKFRNQFIYSKNPEGQLKLSRKLFEFYSRLFGASARVDEETEARITSNVHDSVQKQVVPMMKAELLPVVDQKIQNQFECNLENRIKPVVIDQCRDVINGDIETLIQQALPALVQKEVQIQLQSIKPPSQDELEAFGISINELQAQVGNNKNEITFNNLQIGLNKERSCLNTSLAISICPKLQELLPDVRTMAVPFHVLEEKLPELTKEELKLQKIRQRLNGGAGFSDTVHNSSLNASSSASINTEDIVVDDIPVLEFKKPGEDYEEMEFQDCNNALEDEVGNQSIITNEYSHLINNRNRTEFSKVAAVSPRNDSELSVGPSESDFHSSDHSFASRESFAAPNRAFNRPINNKLGFNSTEKRNAYNRKYAYELKLSPILFNRLHYMILIHNIEFVQILRQMSLSKAKYPIMQGLREEATLILAEIVEYDWSPDKVHAVVYGTDRIDLPKITVNMMHHILEIFELCDINIPYIRAAEMKPFLKLLFKMTTLNFEGFMQNNKFPKSKSSKIQKVDFSRTRCTCSHEHVVDTTEVQKENIQRNLNNLLPPTQATHSNDHNLEHNPVKTKLLNFRPLKEPQESHSDSDQSIQSVLELARTDTQIHSSNNDIIESSRINSSISDHRLPVSEPSETVMMSPTKNMQRPALEVSPRPSELKLQNSQQDNSTDNSSL